MAIATGETVGIGKIATTMIRRHHAGFFATMDVEPAMPHRLPCIRMIRVDR